MTKPDTRKLARKWLRVSNVFLILGVFPAIGTLIALFGIYWWVADLFTHFRVQYALALLLATFVLLADRRWGVGGVYAVLTLWNLMLLIPSYIGDGEGNQARKFRLFNANVNTMRGDPQRLLDAISDYDPDVILLEEIGDRWVPALAALKTDYPFEIVHPKNDNFGIAMYSKRPLIDAEVRFIGHVDLATLTAKIQFENEVVYFIATHTLPPMGALNSYWRNNQLNRLGEHAAAINGHVVLAGDLNVTPWSGHFRRMLWDSRLQDSAKGFGIQATWPADSIWLRIPLDHCLHSSELEIVGREVGPHIGSDHFPIIVDIAFGDAG